MFGFKYIDKKVQFTLVGKWNVAQDFAIYIYLIVKKNLLWWIMLNFVFLLHKMFPYNLLVMSLIIDF